MPPGATRPTSSWRRSPRPGASTARTRRSGPRIVTTRRHDEIAPLLQQLRDAHRRHRRAVRAQRVRRQRRHRLVHTPGTTLAVKAETHNHPSAIEPFGGANTGVGGVIRDVMGAAHRPDRGHRHPVLRPAPTCPPTELPDGVLHPRLIDAGVIAGVADYGNKIGLPTVAGAVLYDPGYTANPLVYCGCIGVADDAPAAARPAARRPGRGARRAHRARRPARRDVLQRDDGRHHRRRGRRERADRRPDHREAADRRARANASGLYTAITDCGAGGLSSAVGEMAEDVGAEVDVALRAAQVPGPAPVGDLAQRGPGAHGARRAAGALRGDAGGAAPATAWS